MKAGFRLRAAMGAAIVVIAAGVGACGKKSGAEKAAEKVDDALHEVKNGPKDLFDKDGPAENAGEKVDKALGTDK